MNLYLVEPLGEVFNDMLRYMSLWNLEVHFERQRFKGLIDKEFGDKVYHPNNHEEYYCLRDCIKSEYLERFYDEFSLLNRLSEFVFYDKITRETNFHRTIRLLDEKLYGDTRDDIIKYFISSYEKHKIMEELVN